MVKVHLSPCAKEQPVRCEKFKLTSGELGLTLNNTQHELQGEYLLRLGFKHWETCPAEHVYFLSEELLPSLGVVTIK
jgi:hypothetical protein